MTTVGFIGSGAIGSTIARLAVEAGHQVVLGNSRGPETLADTVAELGPRASVDTCNYGPERDGPIPELDSTSLTSSAPSAAAKAGLGLTSATTLATSARTPARAVVASRRLFIGLLSGGIDHA